jgi:integrase
MARTVRDAALESRTARSRLKANGQPYYRGLEPGLHLGYRKPRAGAGKWLARHNVEGKYSYHPLGTADDFGDPDGTIILSYKQAQDAARKILAEQAGRGVGTVGDAVETYIRSLEAEGRARTSMAVLRCSANAHILPTLGHIELAKLTSEQLGRWRNELARRPARVRTRSGEPQRHRERSDDADVGRARRASANRIRAMLFRALNLAYEHGNVASDQAWRRVKSFKGVAKARVRYLSVAEGKRLINATRPEFRPLLQAALLTGARYGQLTQLVVSDLNVDAGTLRLRTRKGDGSERVYHVHLTGEALGFFQATCAGRRGSDLIFARIDGRSWGKSQQQALMQEASERAGISPAVNFHATRHTFASLAVMNGAPLLVVAQALGHTDTRQIEKLYGHLAPSYAAEAIRKAAPRYGIKPGNVQPMPALHRGKSTSRPRWWFTSSRPEPRHPSG